MPLRPRLGEVTIHCSRCGKDLGTYLFAGISTATCIGCQKMDADAETEKLEETQRIHMVPGESFQIVTGPVPPTEEIPTDDFATAAKNLFKRTKPKKGKR